MRFFIPVKDCFGRVCERKKTLAAFGALFLLSFILGICFIKTPAIYDYHLTLCDRYIDRVCYSQTSVFLIFIERTAGHAFLLALFLIAGLHPAALIFPPAILVYRAYTFGGSVAIFLSVYRFSGALVVFVLYLPIHLLLDVLFLSAISLSCSRACRFRFAKEEFLELFYDFLILFLLTAAICLLEMILLLALFHPLGNIL